MRREAARGRPASTSQRRKRRRWNAPLRGGFVFIAIIFRKNFGGLFRISLNEAYRLHHAAQKSNNRLAMTAGVRFGRDNAAAEKINVFRFGKDPQSKAVDVKFISAVQHGRVNRSGRDRAEARGNVTDLNECNVFVGPKIELFQPQAHAVVRGRAEYPDADFFANQISGRPDRRMHDDHLTQPVQAADHDQIGAGSPRLNGLRAADEAELHVSSEKSRYRSAGDVNSFRAETVAFEDAGLHAEGEDDLCETR